MASYEEKGVVVERTLSWERKSTKAQRSDPHFCGGTIVRINDSHFCEYRRTPEEIDIIRRRGW